MNKHVHFLGISGSGASAASAIAQANGFKVTGCDKALDKQFTKPFKKNQLFTGHNPKHLDNVDILAISPAALSLDSNNPEIVEAKKRGIPVLTWQEFLGKYLLKDKFVIATCGTHGKSTTTAMIGQMLEDAGLDPIVELGAIVPKWGNNYRIGKSKYFVVEADEFNDNFLNYNPDITIVTNIEMDHPEYFKDFNVYKESFYKFLRLTKNAVVANLSDIQVSELVKHLMKGHKNLEDGVEVKFNNKPKYIQYFDYSKNEFNFPLKVLGNHNKLNANAALQAGLLLKIKPEVIQKSLKNFSGIGRRLEYIGQFKKADIYSDFGHHPTEIRVTTEALRKKFPKRKLWLIYQPHMFTRTKKLFDDFVKVFKSLPAEQALILDIYPSREIDTGKVKSWQIVQSANKANVRYASAEEIPNVLHQEVNKGDVLLFMGAGDIDKLARKLSEI